MITGGNGWHKKNTGGDRTCPMGVRVIVGGHGAEHMGVRVIIVGTGVAQEHNGVRVQ